MNNSGMPSPGPAPATVKIEPTDIVRRYSANWAGIAGDSVEILRREPFDYEFRSTSHLLIVTERAERDDGETVIEGLPTSTLRKFNQKLSFVPAGHRFAGWQNPSALTRVTYFYIEPAGPWDDELAFSDVDFKPRLFFFDRDIWETALKLKSQVQGGGSRPYAEALSAVLAHELVRLNGGGRSSEPVRGGLAAWQCKRVVQFIDEHVARDISLIELAQAVQLSPYHFARAFKQSFGAPPHRYHTARRVERAKELLENPARSVTDIGLELGFSDTSAFTSAFRRITGLTPTSYRRSAS